MSEFILLTQQSEPSSKNKCMVAVSQIELVKTTESNGGSFFCSTVHLETFTTPIEVQETPQEIHELITKATEASEVKE